MRLLYIYFLKSTDILLWGIPQLFVSLMQEVVDLVSTLCIFFCIVDTVLRVFHQAGMEPHKSVLAFSPRAFSAYLSCVWSVSLTY